MLLLDQLHFPLDLFERRFVLLRVKSKLLNSLFAIVELRRIECNILCVILAGQLELLLSSGQSLTLGLQLNFQIVDLLLQAQCALLLRGGLLDLLDAVSLGGKQLVSVALDLNFCELRLTLGFRYFIVELDYLTVFLVNDGYFLAQLISETIRGCLLFENAFFVPFGFLFDFCLSDLFEFDQALDF